MRPQPLTSAHRLLIAAVVPLALALGGCGSDEEETTFTAEEFIEVANEYGAGLVLEQPLSSGANGEVYAISFVGGREATGATGPGAEADVHGGGSLTVTADPDAGFAEYSRCESATTLLCYRVANVVMFFEGASPDDLARLDAAVRAMGEA